MNPTIIQRKTRAISLQNDMLPAINRSTIKYEYDVEGKEICNHHAFCTHQYELNDQSHILKSLSQPLSHFNGAQLPTPKDPCSECSSRNDKSRQGSRQRNKRQNEDKNVSNHKYKRSNTMNRVGITEEALDDWIAQSQNRPIISFLDPYKKFKVPDKLLNELKQRYKKWMQTKERDYEKKLLYFEDRTQVESVPHYQLPTRRPKEAEKPLIYKYKELEPHNIIGTSIIVRENNVWNNRKHNMSNLGYDEEINESFKLPSLHKGEQYAGMKNSKVLRSSRVYQPQNLHGKDLPNIDQAHNNADEIYKNDTFITIKQQLLQQQSQKGKILNQHQPKLSISGGKQLQPLINAQSLSPSNQKKEDEKDEMGSTLSIKVAELLKFEATKSLNKNSKLKHQLSINFIFSNYKSFNKHMECNLNTIGTEKSMMTSVEFAFSKAVRRIQKQSILPAIECLKEALSYDLLFFKAIFNLGCLYEQISQYSHSQNWFEIALSMEEGSIQIHYGLAINCYHMNQFEDCLRHLKEVNKESEFQMPGSTVIRSGKNNRNNNEKQMEYKLLSALSYKQLSKESESAKEYSQISNQSVPQSHLLLRTLLFTMVFKKKRSYNNLQISSQLICKFYNIIFDILNPIFSYSQALQPYYEDNQWVDQVFLIKRLKLSAFFNRFDESDLKKLVSVAKFNVIPKNQIIFSKQQVVSIIVAGTVTLYRHINQIKHPEVIASYGEGDIIGLPEKDGGICNMADIWFLCSSEVEILQFPKEAILELWNKQSNININEDKQNIYNTIRQLDIFNAISEITLLKIAFDLIQVVSYKEGEVIFNDAFAIQSNYMQSQQIQGSEKEVQGIKLGRTQRNSVLDKFANKRRQDQFSNQCIDGVFIIKQGSCEIDTLSNNLIGSEIKIVQNDYFGENLLLENTLSINSFGRILAKSQKVQCYLIPTSTFSKIPIFDIQIIQQNAQNSSKQQDYKKLLAKQVK